MTLEPSKLYVQSQTIITFSNCLQMDTDKNGKTITTDPTIIVLDMLMQSCVMIRFKLTLRDSNGIIDH